MNTSQLTHQDRLTRLRRFYLSWAFALTRIEKGTGHETDTRKIDQHFYSCRYQLSSGEWSTRYYGIFTDWSSKRRKFALGANLKIARKKLDRLKGENAIEKDFDAEKIKPEEGMTVAKWADCYLKLEEIKTKRSFSREEELVATIKRLLGSVLLSQVKREHLFKYRTERLQEYIIRNGKAAPRTFQRAPWLMSCPAFVICLIRQGRTKLRPRRRPLLA